MSVDEEEVNRPLVLVHRPPNFHFPFRHCLATQFNLFDPLDSPDSTRSNLLCRHAFNIRVLLCVDPTPVSSDLLSLLPALELIVGSTVGFDHIDLPKCRRCGITVTNAGVAFSKDVTDLAVGLLIDVLRKISAVDRFLGASSWAKTGDYMLGSKLGGKRVGMVRMGKIGSEVVKRLQAFGCIISYNSKRKKSTISFPYYPDVYKLAVNSDVHLQKKLTI